MAGVGWTKMHTLKAENDVVFEEVLKTIAWETLSNGSEELFQRGSGGDRIYRNLCWKQNKRKQNVWSSIKRLLLITKSQTLKLMIIVLFYIWEDARVWAHWNHSFDMHLSYLGPVSCFLQSKFPSGHTVWGWNADDLIVGNIHYLLKWQARFVCPPRDLGMIRPRIQNN